MAKSKIRALKVWRARRRGEIADRMTELANAAERQGFVDANTELEFSELRLQRVETETTYSLALDRMGGT